MNSLIDSLKKTGYSIHEEVNDDQVVSVPYIIFGANEKNLIADDVVYYRQVTGLVDLYHRKTDRQAPTKVEDAIAGYSWQKEKKYIEEENLMLSQYTIKL